MALKPTIYKFIINLSDLNRDYYDELHLTVAQHPSETVERMLVRVLAYCLNAEPKLTFSKGLSEVEEPDLWVRTLDDQIALWIEVGEPDLERIKKVSRVAKQVKIYSFNTKSSNWWQSLKVKMKPSNAEYFQFDWQEIQSFTQLLERSMALSITITGDSAFIASNLGNCEVSWLELR